MTVGEFINRIVKDGLEYFNLYYGDYEGHVADNEDPENRGRLKIKCPAVYGDSTPDIWAMPKGMFSGKGIGFYAIPQKGDPVWITFRKGNAKYPIWQYGWIPKDYSPELASHDVYIFQTPKGYQIVLNEATEEILIRYSDQEYIKIKDKISIYAGGENLFAVLDGLLEQLLITQNMVTPSGPGEFNPAVKQQLQELKTKTGKLLQ